MGRHSAPDDDDKDDRVADVRHTAVALEDGEPGRHGRPGAPRPTAPAEGDAVDDPDEHAPAGDAAEGLSLIDDALDAGTEPAGAVEAGPLMVLIDAETSEAVPFAPITEEPVEDVTPDDGADDAPTAKVLTVVAARADRPLPEETTARIEPVAVEPVPVGDAGVDAQPDTVASDIVAEPPAEPVAPAEPIAPAEPVAPVAPVVPKTRRHATGHDIALVREHGDVRARCAAAILVPFVVYVVVLAVVGHLTVRTALLWLAVPLVIAGVLVGVFLDAGHRRYPATAPVSAPADRP